MIERTEAPYGSWRSPIRVDDIVADAVRLAEPWVDEHGFVHEAQTAA